MLRMIESVRNITKFLYSHAYVLSLTRKQKGNNELVYSLLVDIMDSNCMHFMSPFLVYLILIISSLPHFIYSHATYIIFLLNPHLFAIEPHLKLNLTRICNVKKLPQAISKYCTTHIRIYLLQCRVSTAHLQIMPSLSLVSLYGCPQESIPLHCYNASMPLYLVWATTTRKKAKASQSFKSRTWIHLSLCLHLLLSSKQKKLDNNDACRLLQNKNSHPSPLHGFKLTVWFI